MLILMPLEAPKQDIEKVKDRLIAAGCKPHEIPGASKLGIGVTGPTNRVN